MYFVFWIAVHVFLKPTVECNFQPLTKLRELHKKYQITLLVRQTSIKRGDSFNEIISQFPTVTIDFTGGLLVKNNRSWKLPIFKNPRQSTIYVIYDTKESSNDYHWNETYNIIDKIIELAAVPMRPKCLLMFRSKNFKCREEIKRLLKHAWTKSFLDFTVLMTNFYDNSSSLINYNPFTNTYNFEILRHSSDLFPDKVKNANKYPLIMPVFNSYQKLMVRVKNETIVKVYGDNYAYIDIIVNKLNFTTHFMLKQKSKGYELREKMFASLERNEIHIIPFLYQINPYLNGKKFITGIEVRESKRSIVVPLFKKTRYNFTLTILMYIISFPVIIFIFHCTVRCLKFDKWKILYIYQILMGFPAQPPKQTVGKMVFFILAFLSIVYSNILFASIADMRVVSDVKNFDSYQDLLDSKMKIYSHFLASDYDTPDVKMFLSRSTEIKSIHDCVTKLIKTRFVICVLPFNTADYLIKTHLDDQRNPIMKLARPTYQHQYSAFPYEKASPFAEKFNEIIQRIKESGILKFQNDEYGDRFSKISMLAESEDTLFQQLIIVSFFGFFIAIFTFLLEMSSSLRSNLKFCRALNNLLCLKNIKFN